MEYRRDDRLRSCLKVGVSVFGLWLAGCTVISVEGDHNRISDAGGHGGVTLPEGDGALTWLERIERIEKMLGLRHDASAR